MAKKMKRFITITMALILCFVLMAPSASAWGWNPPGNNDNYEWYEVYVQGKLVASGQGKRGDVYYLGTHYEAGVNIDGSNLTWYIDPIGSSNYFSDTVNLNEYIEIPEGYEVQDYDIEELSIDGVNDPTYDMYDNAVIRITIKSLYNEDTDDTIIIPDPDPVEPEPTEPEPTEPEPTEPVIPDPVDYEPVLTITKTADKEVYEVGQTVTWTITVTNIGDYLAYDVEVVDPITGDSWYIAYLIPGASREFTVTTVAEEVGTLENTATVTWADADLIPDDQETDEAKSATDSETVTVEEAEIEPTEPEVEPTEPEVEPTEPEVEPTEPEVEPTEPEVEPTEPEVEPTEPEVEPTEPEVEPTVPEVEPTEPEVEPDQDNTNYPITPYAEIPDEDVPLADVPVTGDMVALWVALSAISGTALVALNKKRKED